MPAFSPITAPSSTRAIASSAGPARAFWSSSGPSRLWASGPAGAHITDIGGASGLHAAALARRGDHVLLIDPVPRHVEAARRYGTFTAQLGDARSLPVDDDSFDAALLLGPLYHLCERSDRLRAATAASPAAISTWPTTSRRRRARPGCATCELSGSRGQAPRRSRSAGHTTRR